MEKWSEDPEPWWVIHLKTWTVHWKTKRYFFKLWKNENLCEQWVERKMLSLLEYKILFQSISRLHIGPCFHQFCHISETCACKLCFTIANCALSCFTFQPMVLLLCRNGGFGKPFSNILAKLWILWCTCPGYSRWFLLLILFCWSLVMSILNQYISDDLVCIYIVINCSCCTWIWLLIEASINTWTFLIFYNGWCFGEPQDSGSRQTSLPEQCPFLT